MTRNAHCLLFAASAMLCFASCTREELPDINPVDKEDVPVVTAPVFTATIETTKTVLDGDKVYFITHEDETQGDIISINGVNYEAYCENDVVVFKATTEVEAQPIDSKYNAYYPMEIWNGGKPSLLKEYNYAEGRFNMPLFASHTYEEGNNKQANLVFKHLCGFLGVTVYKENPDGKSLVEKDLFDYVSSITVSTDKNLCGPFTVENDIAVLTGGETGDYKKFITVNIDESLRSISTSRTYYIPIPVAEYSKLMITVEGELGSQSKTAYFITKDGKPGQIDRNQLYNITFWNNFKGAELAVAIESYDDEDGRY